MTRSLPLVLAAALALGACGDADAPAATDAPAEATSDAVAGPNSTVVMDYEGRLADGTVFDSNENIPMPMPQMVPGFRDAVVGMKAGDTKTFDIPPEQAYGASGNGPIPPNATLTFDVTVHEVR